MDDSGGGEEKESIKVGDIEKEKEIERRLRELGLWENKRHLESRVASMLEAHIEEQDVLSRTLRKCRRRRAGEDGGGGKTAVDEIRNIISPRVIRDCYGQKLAYQVNILMGCFTKNIEHEVIDDVVVIRGSTSANEGDPMRLTKELRLELPSSLNMAALQLSYAAGAVKIRVPYLIELPPSLKQRSSESTDVRPHQLSSISPIYALNMALNRTKLGSSGADSLRSDSPNSATSSLLSPLVPTTTTDSLGDTFDVLQPRSSIPESPTTTTLPSPFPVFEDETSIAFPSEIEQDDQRCTNGPTLEVCAVGESTQIPVEVRHNGLTFVSEKGSGVSSRVADSDEGRALSEASPQKSIPPEECSHSTEKLKRNNGIGQHISEKRGRPLIEEYHNGGLGPSDSSNLIDAISKQAHETDETAPSKNVDGKLGNNLRNKASANMAAIYVTIPDSMNISVADDLELAKLTSCEESTSNHMPDHSKWSLPDPSRPAIRGYRGGNRWQDKETVSVTVLNDETNSAERGQRWKTFVDGVEISHPEDIDCEGVQIVRSNTTNRRSRAISAERTLSPFEELDNNLVNGSTENDYVEAKSVRDAKIENDEVVEKEERSSIADCHQDSGKIASDDGYVSDKKVSMISINGGSKTGPFKQNGSREEQREAGFRSVTEDSSRIGASSKSKVSPQPKKPIKILDYLLDSLDETVL